MRNKKKIKMHVSLAFTNVVCLLLFLLFFLSLFLLFFILTNAREDAMFLSGVRGNGGG